MRNKELESLYQMIEYIDKALNYTNDIDFNTFSSDSKTQDATIFNISQIGELIKNISDLTIQKYSNIEWQMIKGLRNRIIHDYSGINLNNIWYIINYDLGDLKKDLKKVINDIEKNSLNGNKN